MSFEDLPSSGRSKAIMGIHLVLMISNDPRWRMMEPERMIVELVVRKKKNDLSSFELAILNILVEYHHLLASSVDVLSLMTHPSYFNWTSKVHSLSLSLSFNLNDLRNLVTSVSMRQTNTNSLKLK
jgi:hypothetical protein